MAAVSDRKMLDEIPSSMQKLARYVVRGFYGVEHGILIDLLIRNVCMLEEELRALLRFDSKQLRAVLVALKNDKLIKERQLVVERAEGRPVKHNYYFINYRALINVLKYKFDHMRRKLESEEKTKSHRAMYKCARCQKTYTDLEINLLWTGEEMQCTYCTGLVEEDTSVGANQATRTSLAQYNEQMWPYFQLLQELDGCQLAPHLLEPTPKLRPAEGDADAAGSTSDGRREMGGRGGDSKRPDFELYKQGFTVNIEGADDASSTNAGPSGPKEVPIWMRASTVTQQVDTVPEDHVATSTLGVPAVVGFGDSPPHSTTTHHHHDIAQALLVHESKSEPFMGNIAGQETTNALPIVAEAVSSGEESEFEEVEEEELFVTVQGKQVSFSELTENPHLISQMTPEEKQHYIKISQQAYDSLNG